MENDTVKQVSRRLKRRLAGEINYINFWRKRIKKTSGTKLGGMKAARTNKLLHGKDFYQRIGRRGGQNGHTGGFASNRELAKLAGAKGGAKSRRGKANKTRELLFNNRDKIIEMLNQNYSIKKIAQTIGIPESTLYKKVRENDLG